MKNQLKMIARSAIVAVAAGALCLATNASAQSASASPSNVDTSGTTSTTSPGTKDKKAAQAQNAEAMKAQQRTGASSGSTTGSIPAKDRAFVNTAAKGNQMEIHMGELAQKQGQSSEVKKLGKQMVTDHTRAASELQVITNSRGITVDTRHKMDKLDSANFDQAWLVAMVRDHQKMLAAFKTESQTGMDTDVKAFATKQLPVLQKHLQLVQAAQAKVGGATGSGTNGGSTATPSATPKKG